MKELPILFSTPMVQALLEGRKTKTRRIKGLEKVNENPDEYYFQSLVLHATGKFTFCEKRDTNPKTDHIIECKPKYQTGDILWVRETWCNGAYKPYHYAASVCSPKYDKPDTGWKPSIHMPKSAARIWLKVTNVKCERLQSISAEDAIKEGIKPIEGLGYTHYTAKKRFTKEELKEGVPYISSPILSFLTLWESINGEESLNANPWVFVYSFEVISITGAPVKNSELC